MAGRVIKVVTEVDGPFVGSLSDRLGNITGPLTFFNPDTGAAIRTVNVLDALAQKTAEYLVDRYRTLSGKLLVLHLATRNGATSKQSEEFEQLFAEYVALNNAFFDVIKRELIDDDGLEKVKARRRSVVVNLNKITQAGHISERAAKDAFVRSFSSGIAADIEKIAKTAQDVGKGIAQTASFFSKNPVIIIGGVAAIVGLFLLGKVR